MAARAMVLDVLVRLKDNLSGGLGRLQGRLRGLADMGRKIGLVGTAIAGISFMGPIQEAAAFQQQLIDMAATADLSGRAAFDFAAKSGAKYEELALKTRLLSRDIAAGAGQMLASNLDPAYIEAVIGDTAKAAKAANADFADMSRLAIASAQNLQIPASEMKGVFAALMTAGKLGRFELRDMAKYFDQLTPQMAKFGIVGREAIDFLGPALQIAMKGASDPAQAANNLKNFLSKALAPDTIKRFKDQNVDLVAVMRDAAVKGINPIEAVLQKVNKLTGVGPDAISKYMGEAKKRGLEGGAALEYVKNQLEQIGAAGKLGELFGDQQVLDFLVPFMGNIDEYRKIKAQVAAATGEVIDKDFETQVKTFNSELIRSREIGDQLQRMWGAAFGPYLTIINDNLERLMHWVREVDAASGGWGKTAMVAAAGAVVLAVAIGALAVALPAVVAGLSLMSGLAMGLLWPLRRASGALGNLWRSLSTGGRNIGEFNRGVRGMGPAADQAGRSVNNRLSGIMGTARGMIAAGWIIPLAFEFFDDMGRTPEQRIAQIGKNHEQYEKVAKAVEESSFGQWWTQLKASANNAMGLQAGEVPVDFFVAKFKKAADDMRAAIEPFRFDLAEIRDWKIDWSGLSPAAIIPFWTELATAVNSAVEALKGLREKFSLDNLLPEGVKDAKDASKGGADMGSRVGKPPEATAPAAPNASPDQARRAGDRFGRMIAPAQPPARLEGNITATIKVEGPGKVTSITSDNKNIRVDAAGRMLGRV